MTEYADTEPVYCRSSGKYYEAKIIEVKVSEEGTKYKVHYNKWNARFDEWVNEDKLLKRTPENEKLMKETGSTGVRKGGEKRDAASLSKSASSAAASSSSSSASSKKRKGPAKKPEESSDSEDGSDNENGGGDAAAGLTHRDAFRLPPNFKKLLVADWNWHVQKKERIVIPRSPCIDDIMAAYLAEKKIEYAADSSHYERLSLMFTDLKEHFNHSVHKVLLYNTERDPQSEINAKDGNGNVDASFTHIYGLEHLLRLFVKIPDWLPPKHVTSDLQKAMQEFFAFLSKPSNAHFIYPPYIAEEPLRSLFVAANGNAAAASSFASASSSSAPTPSADSVSFPIAEDAEGVSVASESI